MTEIIDSYFNGQYTQMVEQIDAYGSALFVTDLRKQENLTTETLLHILEIFVIKKG
jgi:hypothetical protein